MSLHKKTKIVATIGPASEKKSTLEKMIKAGMNVARLNFSHSTYDQHAILIANIRAAAKKSGQAIALMQDLQGPRIRVGEVQRDGIELSRSEKVVLAHESLIDYKLLVTGADNGQTKIIPLGYKDLHKFVKPGKHILINDGLIDIKVTKIKDQKIYGTVVKPGIIFSHKGINLPGIDILTEVITKKDREDLAFGLKQGVDFIALSFVRDAKDVLELRKLIDSAPGNKIRNRQVQIIAKVERKEALINFDEILAVSDGIMVARGDLGIEISPADVPLAQKMMIEKCMVAAKPVIVATQMLESMILNPRPTRAEVSDVANAVIDHTDAVMLSGESAFGKYPVEAVKMMADIVQNTEESRFDDLPAHYLKVKHQHVDDAMSFVAYDLAKYESVKAIIVDSLSGHAAKLVARHRPEVPMYVLTDNEETVRAMALTWGATAVQIKRCKNLDELIKVSVQELQKRKVVKKGQYVVVVAGQPVGKSSITNIVKLHGI